MSTVAGKQYDEPRPLEFEQTADLLAELMARCPNMIFAAVGLEQNHAGGKGGRWMFYAGEPHTCMGLAAVVQNDIAHDLREDTECDEPQ